MFMFVYSAYPLHIADRMPSGELLRKEPLEQIMKVGGVVGSVGEQRVLGLREWIACAV